MDEVETLQKREQKVDDDLKLIEKRIEEINIQLTNQTERVLGHNLIQ